MNLDLKRVFAILVLMLLTALLFLPLVGCRAKKTESQKKEEIKTQDFSGIFRNSWNSYEFLDFEKNLKINSLTTFDEENETTTISKKYSPINSAIPASFIDENGKKQELNNTNYTEEKKTEKNKRNSQNSQNSQEILKSESKKKLNASESEEIKKKAAAKKSAEADKVDIQQWKFPLWIWIVIILIVMLVLAYLAKRFGWLKYVTAFVSRLFQIRKK